MPRETCRNCGYVYYEADDGWNGLCPSCADRVDARNRCADCGEPGERVGHMGCQYPQDHR